MFILSFIRSLYKTLSADASPRAIAFGVAFGIAAGCVPVTSRLGIFLLLSILIVRVQITSALFAWGLTRLACVSGLAALFNPVGGSLLNNESLHGFWTWFLNLPVVAWLELEREAILGGILVGVVLGAVILVPVERVVGAYRKWVAGKLEDNKFFRWLVNFWVVKALRFVFVGTRP